LIWRIRSLDLELPRLDFRSGCDPLDTYFREVVGQDMRRGLTACFTAMDPDGRTAGFYTLASCGTLMNELPESLGRKLPRYPTLPAVLLGRLAVDLQFQGKGLGGILLVDALKRCIESDIAAYALVVDAIDDSASRFYAHHGFQPFAHHAARLFLPLATAKRLFHSA